MGPVLGRQERDLLAGHLDHAAGGPQVAGDAVDQGRLSRAVPADQPDDLARPDLDRHVLEGLEAAEGDGDTTGDERQRAGQRPERSLGKAALDPGEQPPAGALDDRDDPPGDEEQDHEEEGAGRDRAVDQGVRVGHEVGPGEDRERPQYRSLQRPEAADDGQAHHRE